MAEISRFWTTDGVGDGPSTEYTSNNFSDVLAAIFGGGVLKGADSELICSTNISGKAINVHSGAAIVAGRFYRNDSLLSLGFTPPLIGNTGFRVVLRSDWSKNNTRAYLKTSSGGNPDPPLVTTNYGVTWEITLCTGLIINNSNFIIYDVKDWAEYSTSISDGSITDYELANNSVTTEKIASKAITGSKLSGFPEAWAGASVTSVKIAALAITNEKIADATIVDADFAVDALLGNLRFVIESVTRPKIGIGGLRIVGRRGGSSIDWSAPGNNLYNNFLTEIQSGVIDYQMSSTSKDAHARINFQYPYTDGPPILILTVEPATTNNIPNTPEQYAYVRDIYKDYAYCTIVRPDTPYNFADGGVLHWMAIGGRLF